MVMDLDGRGRRRWLVGPLLVIGLVVGGAGCATDDGDDPAPTSAPSPTTEAPTEPATDEPTTVPTPWPEPSPPPEMERDDIEGAKAAAVYFIELHQYVYATGDIEKWQEMSHPECQFCSGAVARVDGLYGSGGYAVGGRFETRTVGALEPDEQFPHYRVGIEGEEQPSSEFSRDGELLRETNGGSLRYNFGVIHSDGAWTVRGVAVDRIDPS